MRRNIKLISAAITVILFFVLNAIMSAVDLSKPSTARVVGIVSVVFIGVVLLSVLGVIFIRRRKKYMIKM